MAPGTGLPRRLVPVRFRRFPACRKNEFDEQPVLLDHTELMAILAYDIPMPGKLPCSICIFHQVTAVAKFGVFLDIIIVSDGQHNPQYRDDEHQTNEEDFLLRVQAPFKPVDYF
jgi:hypothetical protein